MLGTACARKKTIARLPIWRGSCPVSPTMKWELPPTFSNGCSRRKERSNVAHDLQSDKFSLCSSSRKELRDWERDSHGQPICQRRERNVTNKPSVLFLG